LSSCANSARVSSLPRQQRLYFFPLPHGHGSLRPGRVIPVASLGGACFSRRHAPIFSTVNMTTSKTVRPSSFVACAAAFLCIGHIAAHGRNEAAAIASGSRSNITMTSLRAGDRIAERAYLEDQIEWKLPKKRLEPFRRAGVIIKEDRRISIEADAVVVSAQRTGASLQTHERISSFDVPRHRVTVSEQTFAISLEDNNVEPASSQLSEAQAAMVGFPVTPTKPGFIGQRWRTRLPVVTTLGSGMITLNHVIAGVNDGRVQINVEGRGIITGMEYHLPKLLPGTISLTGTAWYDPSSGLVSGESYLIHNQLLKPAEGEQIGFDERLTVDSTTHKISVFPKR
jgi:hypothetical protein